MSDHNIKSDFNEWVAVLGGASARPEQLVEAVFLDAALQLYGGIAVDTPVDTGFLRAGLSASTAGVDPVKRGDRPATAKPGQFTSVNDGLAAIAQAAHEKTPLDMGFQ